MKYLIYKEKSMKHCVIFAEHTSHLQVRVDRSQVISGGYFTLNNGIVKVYGESTSLNVKPTPDDEYLISATLSDCGIYAFMTYE